MNPQPPTQPPVSSPTNEQIASNARTNKLKLIWGLICLIGPTTLIIVSILAYAIINFTLGAVDTGSVSNNSQLCDSSSMTLQDGANAARDDCKAASLFGEDESTGVGRSIANVIMFIIGAIAVLTWLPGIVVGIVLLATRKSVP